MEVLVTGAKGFIGRNLVVVLGRRHDVVLRQYDRQSPPDALDEGLRRADIVFHLAGVNRPERTEEFAIANAQFSRSVCTSLRRSGRKPILVFPSSTQAALANPYGVSKREAEEAFFAFGAETGARVAVFRLPGVFGKWCRPNYNSVVATFCHNIARDLPITSSDPGRELELVYIDDVVAAFIRVMDGQFPIPKSGFCYAEPTFQVTVGTLAETIRSFRKSRSTLLIPDFSDRLVRSLYATYLSHLPTDDFAYALKQHADQRGELAELTKSPHVGQIFVSRTRPGLIRGNHYHDRKVEKFAVLDGDAVIRLRNIMGDDVIEYWVSGKNFQVVDIPPGYTHSVENVGKTDLIVLFWANEIFDPSSPDTYPLNVL